MDRRSIADTSMHREYFPHIDGIRALAVIPVLLFHLNEPLCSGGFAGVDVFFVISGYLITTGILSDLESGSFSLRNFYYRRMRRIMPAYFTLIAIAFAIGCSLYFATPLIHLGDSVVAGTLFIANFHFLLIANDYFAPTVHSEALLHLWSLSVEEQFYIFIPLLIAAIWRFRPRFVAPVLALLALVSFSLAVVEVAVGNQSSAFYLLHFRAWELLAGALLATLKHSVKTRVVSATSCHDCKHPALLNASRAHLPRKCNFLGSVLGIIGLILVLVTYLGISSETPFPGAAAVAPVVGTVLLLQYGDQKPVHRLLCFTPFVFIGRLSYSLYLWHWPVVVFWRYMVYEQVLFVDYVGMCSASLLLGYLSWAYVENPVRTLPFWTVRRVFLSNATCTILFVAVGTSCVYGRGWATVLHPEANRVAYMPLPKDPLIVRWPLYAVRNFMSRTGCRLDILFEHERRLSQQRERFFAGNLDPEGTFGASGRASVFLVGDSHAGHLKYGLDRLFREREMSGYFLTHGAGSSVVRICADVDSMLEQLARSPGVTHVILASMWNRRRFLKQGQHQDIEELFDRLEKIVEEIIAMDKTPVIVTDVPAYPHSPADVFARTKIVAPRYGTVVRRNYEQSIDEYNSVNGEINSRIKLLCERHRCVYVPLDQAFIVSGRYVSVESVDGIEIPLYRDADHLSARGSLRASQFIFPYLFPAVSQ